MLVFSAFTHLYRLQSDFYTVKAAKVNIKAALINTVRHKFDLFAISLPTPALPGSGSWVNRPSYLPLSRNLFQHPVLYFIHIIYYDFGFVNSFFIGRVFFYICDISASAKSFSTVRLEAIFVPSAVTLAAPADTANLARSSKLFPHSSA